MINRQDKLLWAITGIVFLSRIPFLFDGYGSEEDAWALPLVAERIALSGQYEVSRLPGHPFQELIYTLIYQWGPLAFNLLTALFGTIAVHFFMRFMIYTQTPHAFAAGIALAFTPVVYIQSTNAMDYMWSLAFSITSLYFLIKEKPIGAGILLGLSIGCRITAGALIVPYTFLIWQLFDNNSKRKKLSLFIFSAFFTSLLLYTPVIHLYGFDFFKYYEHFPLPGFTKNFYKGSIGVWGLPGFVMLCVLILAGIFQYREHYNKVKESHMSQSRFALLSASSGIVFLYLISFIKLPWKSAFLIPLVPFVIVLICLLAGRRTMMLFASAMIISSFFMGINLAEPHRGSKVSRAAVTFNIGGQFIAMDFLQGLVPADLSKRRQRTAFAQSVLNRTIKIHNKTVIIAGWWLADILVLEKRLNTKNENVEFRYYCNTDEMQSLHEQGYTLYYLEDQSFYNDLRFNQKVTEQFAKKFETGV